MLFGGDAGHRLEPVGEMGASALDGPVLHGVGHGVGDVDVELLAVLDRVPEGPVGLLGQALPHRAVIEHHAAEDVGEFVRAVCSHDRCSFHFAGAKKK